MTDHKLDRQRIRFTYEKGDTIKFISHQDEARLWERTLRRANLPLLYKQGFNPQPHIQFAAPLGLGMTGVNEIVDVIFSPPVPLDELKRRVKEKLPPGVSLHRLAEVPLKTAALQSQTLGADYTIRIYAVPGEIAKTRIWERIDTFLAEEAIWRERERHGEPYRYNLRPLVFELHYDGYDPGAEEHRIRLRVQMRPGATGRPDEVVDVLGFDNFARTLRRERIYFKGNQEDVALFARYPVVRQEEISPKPTQKRRGRQGKRRPPRQGRPDGQKRQSFAEKAADEFV